MFAVGSTIYGNYLVSRNLPLKNQQFDCIFKRQSMDLDVHGRSVEYFAGKDAVSSDGDAVQEPVVGMEFDSENAAKEFYDEYARRKGFIMRVDQCRRSEVDKRILSRRLSCNKQGFYVKMRDRFGPARKPRPSTREGCKAMMLVKVNKSGKWVVTRFVNEHSHPLVIGGCSSRNAMDGRDRRIEELIQELERQDQLCKLYRDRLITFLKAIEEQTDMLSTKIQLVVKNVKDFEYEVPKGFQHR